MFSFVKMAFLRSPRRTIEFVDKREPLLRGQLDMLHDQFTEYLAEPAYRIITHFNSWLRCKTKSKMKKVIMPPPPPPPKKNLLKGAQISTGNLFFESQGRQNRTHKKRRERERKKKGGGEYILNKAMVPMATFMRDSSVVTSEQGRCAELRTSQWHRLCWSRAGASWRGVTLAGTTGQLTLRASLSGTFLQILPEVVTPLNGHSLSPRICLPTLSAPSERSGY